MSQSKHSNSDTDNQGLSESLKFLERNPKRTFMLMVAILVLSIIGMTAYHLLKKPYERKELELKTSLPIDPLAKGFSELMSTGGAVSEVLKLEREITQLTEKDSLTKTDSIALLDALNKLEAIQKKLNPTKK